MRDEIIALINSDITAYRVSKDTGIPQNTATRIFSGEASIDNISLKNAEILSNYYKKMEVLKMSKKLKALLKDGEFVEGIDYWSIGLYESPDMTVTRNLGVQNVWIQKYTVEIEEVEKEVFAVVIETVAEIVNWNNGESTVLHKIVENPTYDSGEYQVVEAFESYDTAYKYAVDNYPIVDLGKLIKAHYSC